jgi:hypothetical protein
MKENEMGRAYSIYRRDEKYIKKILSEHLKRREHLRHQCRWEDNIEMNLKERGQM